MTDEKNISFTHNMHITKVKLDITPDEFLTNESNIEPPRKVFTTYVFAHFDICNFTKYKREHGDWIVLLKKFLNTIASNDSLVSMDRFWKFNGDSVTYRRKVTSIDEICNFIDQADQHLRELQGFLNKHSSAEKSIYVKAAVWIAGFPKNKTTSGFSDLDPSDMPESIDYSANNNLFYTSLFGEEFVGENIDEGFRLASCSKAGKLVIDPKIVSIIHSIVDYYDLSQNDVDHTTASDRNHSPISQSIAKKPSPLDNKEYCELLKRVDASFYFMEYVNCKGVWNNRDYPIYWYIDNLDSCELIYDEIVDRKKLRDHKVYKLRNAKSEEKSKIKHELYEEKDQLQSIFVQNEVMRSVLLLVDSLTHTPTGYSEETIYETANLYYMIACVVVKDGEDKGVLIFRRHEKRKHLKYVWDLVPIKHGTTYNSDKSEYSIIDYLNSLLKVHLGLTDDLKDSFRVEKDQYRNSIRPLAFCNVFRSGKAHNGILCVAEAVISCDVDEFVEQISTMIKREDRYSEVQLVPFDAIRDEDGIDNVIHVNDKKIISLSPSEVKQDSNDVASNPDKARFKPDKNEKYEKGIAYLGHSIKQVLKERESRKGKS